jgi:hypothetical protein
MLCDEDGWLDTTGRRVENESDEMDEMDEQDERAVVMVCGDLSGVATIRRSSWDGRDWNEENEAKREVTSRQTFPV